MTVATLSFWPDSLPFADVLPPVAILRQAAGELPVKSRNIFEAEVLTTRVYLDDGDEFVHRFLVVVPALGRYCYPLFVVRHDSELVYPAHVAISDDDTQPIACSTQESLIACIRETLNSHRVNSILYSLAARLSATPEGTK